ncbi:hypothetical protein NIES2119_10975 [[Phormidium ambiguum] IAM M-71]|uniref:Calcium-binding protein n=1 Tax=[Phormidium ambiguum] IAM M-71 TaxID=454136 RepID=A0A1U7ILJ0_9CYAN|nr:hypothetical protein [Phormidium ambiguum]OKH38076.1 hypothetical protein NIES2119_10975 [Phormidium ambiguum IAM M-71]
MSFAIFDEQFYLANNPDVQAAVKAGTFSSGREHFEKFGLEEGRVSVSPQYDEAAYLRKYPDVATAVNNGLFSSGIEHYIQIGQTEGRSGTPFNEEFYLLAYPDIADAVKAGQFSSGLDHYLKFGQYEERGALFTGTSGSDRIQSFGKVALVSGVDLLTEGGGIPQVDALIGGNGLDLFTLGDYYVGAGNADYAVIQNFNPLDFDMLGFFGQPSDYNFQVANGNTNISTTTGDLVAVVEGATNLSVFASDPFTNIFIVG